MLEFSSVVLSAPSLYQFILYSYINFSTSEYTRNRFFVKPFSKKRLQVSSHCTSA